MYFKKIYMHGFKSFAEPVNIEFDNGVTCIVGPNGSGKSNISDALRWVLGEQSPKALRGGKMDEVIFAGTASRKSRGMAEVTLTIDNSEGILPIDYSEVAITRRMFRSGESEYLINNNQCRLRDIRELIMDTGIGVDGYSIIGQGKIADIVSGKPETRREIFEEAAGIVMYRSKKEEAEKKLASSNANLERVNDIISEIEGRIDGLREDSAKATEYLKLRERYKELEINITLKNIENLELKQEYLKDDIAELSYSIGELGDRKKEIDAANEENIKRQENLEALSQETSAKLLAAVEEINELKSRSDVSRERLASIDENRERLTGEIKALEEKLEKEQSGAAGIFKEKERLDGELEELGKVLGEKLAKYESMTKALGDAAGDIDEKKSSIYELHSMAQGKRSEAASLGSLKGSLERRRAELETEDSSAGAERENALGAAKTAREEKNVLERDLEAARTEIKDVTSRYNASLSEEKTLAKELEELRITIGQLSGRKKTIEEMESNYEGYNQAVRFMMKAPVNGIEGVVAELISVPSGFETAIETALGAGLQNIVCRDDRSAQEAIAELKAKRAGRLTFLPLASIRGGVNIDPSIEGAPGVKGYASECIEFDEKYRKVFEYLLGRTVVVDTLANAAALSKKSGSGLRFVTLEGEIINAGGAITGGKYKNNTANLLERKAEISKLAADIDAKTAEKEAKSSKLDEIRTFIEKAAADISAASGRARDLEIALVTALNKLEIAESVLADLDADSEKRVNELARIDAEQKKSDEMAGKLLAEAEEAEKKAEDAAEAAKLAMSDYEAKKEELDNVNEEIVNARMAVTACEEQKNSADSIASRVNETIAEIRSDIEAKQAEKDALFAQRESLTSGAGDSELLIDEKTKLKEKLESYAAEIAEEKAEVTAALGESSTEKNEIDEQIEGLRNSKYETEIKQARNETQLENLKEKLWEEFELSYVQAIEFKKKDFAMSPAVKESRDLKNRIRELGEVNIGSIKEYESVSERYEFLTTQRADILTAAESLNGIISDMDKTIKARFKENFDAVQANFEEIFEELFGGGHAELSLEDENNPLESGVEITAQPPGKKLQNINLLSGGEKTMTAIALMFAILKTKPTPFCILDEVEAALDEVNIDRFANYLKNFTGIQFALVTHQKATMEHADVLYGVTMPEQGISKVISLKLGDSIEL